MKRDLLKEAIADAKAVKETAIANAKVALEEAFSPKLREMFAEKMDALDEEDATYEGAEKMDEDELNLEEILAELESLEEEETEMEESINEAEEEEAEEEFDIENMSEEDLKSFIESVVDEMITSGELEAGEESEKTADDMDGIDDLDSEESEEMINIDELLAEMQDESDSLEEMEKEKGVNEIVSNMALDDYLTVATVLKIVGSVAAGVGGLALSSLEKKDRQALAQALKAAFTKKAEEEGKSAEEIADETGKTEMEETINELRNELNEVNLLNAKLLYTNKIFKAKNLSENQKVKVLSTFDKASSVKEVKLVYESLSSSLNEKKKAPIKESLGFASKTISKVESKEEKPIIAEDKMVTRFQKLAGIIK
jgi:hypothetical protein